MSEIIGRLEETSGGNFVHFYGNEGIKNLLAKAKDLPEFLQRNGNATEKDYKEFKLYGIPFSNGPC